MECKITTIASPSADIIAAGPILPADDMTFPRRIVLRELVAGAEYVTHIEIFSRDLKQSDFSNGHYFNAFNEDLPIREQNFRKALNDFCKRILELI